MRSTVSSDLPTGQMGEWFFVKHIAVFGESADSKSTVYRWLERFKDGCQTVEDDLRSGRPRTATTDGNFTLWKLFS